ncbi:MAG: hypothetical protein Q9213_003976 [Squamulea squamosa]
MAKLNQIADSDDELPDLSTVLAECTLLNRKQKTLLQESKINTDSSERHCLSTQGISTETYKGKKQRSLKVAHVNSILLSLTNRGTLSADQPPNPSAQRGVKFPSEQVSVVFSPSCPSDSDDVLGKQMCDFTVDGSDSEEGEEGSKGPYRRCFSSRTQYGSQEHYTQSTPRAPSHLHGKGRLLFEPQSSLQGKGLKESEQTQTSAKRGEHIHRFQNGSVPVRKKNQDDNEEPVSVPKFSPPKLKSPSRLPPLNQVATSPPSPTKFKLSSPTKKFRMPPSPHRPSIDAFWSQEVINDWNDSHSPRKPTKSPHRRKINTAGEDHDDYLSPCENGRRSPSKNPSKADKQAAEKRKAFNEKKFDLAAAFLKELDQRIVNGRIARLTEPTGGVRLVWSKKLQSTAGRANWKREAIRTKGVEVQGSTTEYRHHASIELAEKVIENEGTYHSPTNTIEAMYMLTVLIDRLINVIAHEYCHLLNFMISNIKDNPHGKEFKVWAKKCSAAFAHRGVNVTTTHVYEISYKYIWACSKCEIEYKRHSKSIDPARHSCGKCHKKLVQVKPTPRGEGKGMSEYQKFVKGNFARVKRERPEMGMGEVMAALGREFREGKEKPKGEVVVLSDDGPKTTERCGDEETGLDSIVRKLDFLELRPK